MKISCNLCGRRNKNIVEADVNIYTIEYRREEIYEPFLFGNCPVCNYPINCCGECMSKFLFDLSKKLRKEDIYLECAISHDEEHKSVDLVS